MSTLVPLFAVKSKRELAYLSYDRADVNFVQRRLAGRYCLLPAINLDDYKARAVIDWVKLRVVFLQTTQFQWVQKAAYAVLGRTLSVDSVDEGRGRAASIFDITFQEQDLSEVRSVCKALDDEFCLNSEPTVQGIEVSIDFTPRRPSDTSRARMHAVLVRHLFVDPDQVIGVHDRPRFAHGIKPWQTKRVIAPHLQFLKGDELALSSSEQDRAPYVDATYYIGSKVAVRRWRIMDKEIDRQNRRAGTFLNLSDNEKRTRVEVTLGRAELQKLALRTLSDLHQFKFTTLQGAYFKFMLPTFQSIPRQPFSMGRAMRSWQEKAREAKFLTSGVIGLTQMDRVLERRAVEIRKDARKILRRNARIQATWKHRKAGRYGTLQAYEDLNARVEMALRKLSERMSS